MAKVVGDIAIKVGADIGPLVREMGKGSRATDNLGRASDRVSRRLRSFGNSTERLGKRMSIVSGAIAGAAAAAFALASSTAKVGDEIAKTARGAGVSADYFQEMGYAIGQVSDLTDQEFSGALQRLSRTIGDGAKGTKTAANALEQLGFTQQQVASGTITTQQAFDAYIKKMDGIKDPAIAAAISSDLLGRSGAKLGAQLAGSAGSVASLRDRSRELGIVLSKGALDSSEKFGDQMDDLKRSFEAVRLKLGAELLPLFTETLIPALQEKVIPAIVEFGNKMGDVVQWFNDLPGPVQESIGIITGVFAVGGPLMIAIGLFAKTLGALVAASGPVGLFIAAAALAFAAWQKWGDDIKAAIGPAIEWITGKFNAFIELLQSVINKAKEIKQAIVDALTFGDSEFNPLEYDPNNAYQSGNAIAGGLIEGLGQGLEDRQDELEGYLQGITDKANEVYDIQSPSRVFAEIGDNIGAGLAQGIAQSQAMVEQAVATLGGAAVRGSHDTAQGVISNMQTMFQGSKKISAALAMVNSWLSFTEVLKDPSFIGRPWARIAAAGAALASGLSAVASLKSVSMSGGGGGGGGGSTASAAPAAPQERRVAEFRFMGGNVLDPRAIVDAMNDAYDQGYQIRGVLG